MKWFWNSCSRETICLLAAGALSEEEQFNLERHLVACKKCRNFLTEIQAVTVPLADWQENMTAVQVSHDARRRWSRVIQECAPPSSGPQRRAQSLAVTVWRELFLPNRSTWAVIAALWVAMLVVNLHFSEPGINAMTRASSPQDMMQAWLEQNRVLAELTPQALVPSAPLPDILPPRSQRETNLEII